MIQCPVYILESPSLSDIADQRSEATVTSGLVKLLDWPCTTSIVTDRSSLSRVALELQSGHLGTGFPFRILIVSAHGCESGIGLTDGSLIKWDEFYDSLGVAVDSMIILFSSCKVLADESMRQLLDSREHQPEHVIGFREEVEWHSAATALSMLVHSVARDEQDNQSTGPTLQSMTRMLNTFSAIWQLLGIDVRALNFYKGGSGSVLGKQIRFSSDMSSVPDDDIFDADSLLDEEKSGMLEKLKNAKISNTEFLQEMDRIAESYIQTLSDGDPDNTGVNIAEVPDLAFRQAFHNVMGQNQLG